MADKGATNFSFPDDGPPGFPTKPFKPCAAAAGVPINQNPTWKEIRPFEQNKMPPRRSSRKRSRPQFYKPPSPPKPSAAATSRRGRPPKSRLMSRHGHFETVARNSNQVSRVQLRSPQEQMSSFISSRGIAKDQYSSLQVNDSVFEHGSQTNTYPSPHSHVGRDTHTKKSTTDISVDKIKPKPVQISGFHAYDIEETLIDVSVTEVPGSISFHGRAQSVADPKTLQHVANALHYMAESQTTVDDTKVKSRSSDFTKSLVHTLEAINKKHGDITRDCSLESDCIRTFVLLGVCKVVKDLEKKHLKDLDINSLGSYYTAVRDAENVKLNVQWLRRRLDEIRDACNLSDEAKGLKNERDRLAGNIDRKRQEISACRVQLGKLKSEVHYLKDQLALDLEMVEELNYEMSKWSRFQHANLMDGLI